MKFLNNRSKHKIINLFEASEWKVYQRILFSKFIIVLRTRHLKNKEKIILIKNQFINGLDKILNFISSYGMLSSQ